MATSMKKAVTDEVTIEQPAAKKKFNEDDLIPCRSITNGKLIFSGKKSGMVYKWTDYNDVEFVEYRDLMFAVRDTNNNSIVYKPRFIIMDNDFVAANKRLADFYSKLYSTEEFEDLILNSSASQLRNVVNELPDGARDCMKGIVSTMINDGRLDSVKKIKALDEIFETEMLLMLASN